MPKKKLQLAFEDAAKAAGIVPWPQNGLGHSFCSYAVAHRCATRFDVIEF
jgi:hypothetical protein